MQKPPIYASTMQQKRSKMTMTTAATSGMKKDKNNFIGGTIAVPPIDPMDISCRSDLTQDLIPDVGSSSSLLGTSASTRASSVHPHRYTREYLRKNSTGNQTNDPLDASCHSFHTAANFARNSDFRSPELNDEDGAKVEANEEDLDQLEFPALDEDEDEDDNSEMRALDEQAEKAAIAAFGGEAASQRIDAPLRRSTLVAENATIDVSWFAARGLMSRRSFERYKEEMKSKVITSASNTNLRDSLNGNGRRRNHRSKTARRASISMGDLRNQEWPTATTVEKPEKKKNSKSSRPIRRASIQVPPKPRSWDGLDEYADLAFESTTRYEEKAARHPHQTRRASLDHTQRLMLSRGGSRPIRRASVAYKSTPAPPGQIMDFQVPPKPRSLDGLDDYADLAYEEHEDKATMRGHPTRRASLDNKSMLFPPEQIIAVKKEVLPKPRSLGSLGEYADLSDRNQKARRRPTRRASITCKSTSSPPQQIAIKVPPKPRSLDGLDDYADLAVLDRASLDNQSAFPPQQIIAVKAPTKPRSLDRLDTFADLSDRNQKARRRPIRRASITYNSTPSLPRQIAIEVPPQPRSLHGLDDYADLAVEPTRDSEGLDDLVKSFVLAFKKKADEQEVSDTDLKSSLTSSAEKKNTPKKNDACLNSNDLEALTEMLKRLSGCDDSPYPSENEEDSVLSIQDELELNGMKRDCSADDLMNSSEWENEPLHKAHPSSMENARPTNMFQRSSSIKSINTLKAGNESSVDRLGYKYVPRRTSNSSIQLKDLGLSSSSCNRDDSFITAQVERNVILSKPSASPKEYPGDSISSLLSNVSDSRNNSEESKELEERHETGSTLGCDDDAISRERSGSISSIGHDSFHTLSPQKKTFVRGDTGDTLSTKSPLQEEEQDDSCLRKSPSNKLQMPELDNGVSMVSVNSTGAVTRETIQSKLNRPQLDRETSLASVTSNYAVTSAEPTLDDSLSTIGTFALANNGSRRGGPLVHGNVPAPNDTEDAVIGCIHDEMNRFDMSDNQDASFGADKFPQKNSRPPRRHSMSSHASSGSSLMLRRNSFSTMFTTPADLDELEGPPLKEACGDVLEEGMEYLSMAMLVNVYAKLRELSMLGHASVKLQEIDVNSHQSLARKKEMRRLGLLDTANEPYLDSTKNAAAIVRTVLDEYELFKASSELTSGFANKASQTYDESLLSEFKTWVEESRVKQLDTVTEEVIKTLREECLKQQIMVKERSSNNSLSTMEQANVRKSIARRRGSLIEKSNSFEDASWLKQERTLIADHFGINSDSVPKSNRDCDASEDSRRISNGILTESMIERTLDKSNCYFEEGSSLRGLLESGVEVVWFADRHPDDLTYCICINRATVTVTVVFRGQEGLFDLIKNSDVSKYANPIAYEDYEGNSDFINLRSSVSDEMMRVRRDTKRSTLDEIRKKISEIGSELSDGGHYHLSVSGHSKGAGLATVAGYYLASDPSLKLASAVRVFTFSSSRVGCKAFQQSFKHLEETGRLQHARFTNSGDIGTILPMWDAYHHVGLQIRLHKANRAGRQRVKQSLDVCYNTNENRIEEAFHFVMNFFSAKASRISEYQHRLHFAREYRLALGEGVLRFDKKRNHLKSLNDYYLMKCRLRDFMGSAKDKTRLPSFLVFFVVSCLISFEAALLFKFVATW